MKALEFTAEVDTHHCLRLSLPETTAPGPVRVLVLLPEADETGPAASDDETEGVWMRGVAHEWRAELADEREDIYTLEDGEPVHAAR